MGHTCGAGMSVCSFSWLAILFPPEKDIGLDWELLSEFPVLCLLERKGYCRAGLPSQVKHTFVGLVIHGQSPSVPHPHLWTQI